MAALALGALGDLLLRGGPPGLGATLWAWALVLAALLLRAGGRRPRVSDLALAGMAAATAAVFFLRAAEPLFLLAAVLLALTAAASLLDFPRRSGALAWFMAAVATALAAAGMAVAGLVGSTRLSPDRAPAGAGRWIGVGFRGALLAAPLILVIGALFHSADPVFARYLQAVIDLGLEEFATHALRTFALAWVAGGLLYAAATLSISDPRIGPGPARRAAGEVGVALLLLDLLFLGFLAVQARSLFGGRALVEATAGLSYAEYARGGFFQLALVASIALPVVVLADWVIPPGDPRRRSFVALAGGLVVGVVAILASAAHRMALYLETYGLTEPRLYTTMFMVWLAIAAALVCATVLRGRRETFPALALAAAWAVVMALAALDPADTVVRTNVARAGTPAGFDAPYAASLGADAVPALLDAMERVEPEARCVIARSLLRRWADAPGWDWRSWNLARRRAEREVAAAAGRLREEARACPADPDSGGVEAVNRDRPRPGQPVHPGDPVQQTWMPIRL